MQSSHERETSGASDPTRLIAPGSGESQAQAPGGGLEVEMRLGPYRVLRELGRGGMGVVYLAEDTSLGRQVAIKVLPRGAESPEAIARFRREAEAASRLDHPNLCGVLSFGATEGTYWIAMRYVRGRSLADWIEDRAERARTSPAATRSRADTTHHWQEVVALMEQIARAAHAAHEAGIVHRDLKPSNIMIAEDGTPIILDFGTAFDLDDHSERLTRTGGIIGTPDYMSPEQLHGERIDRRTDVWALGMILYEMLTGRLPFEAPTLEVLYHCVMMTEPPRLRKLYPGAPRDLEVVAATALEKSRDRRYASSLLFAEDLHAVLHIEPIRARPPSLLRRAVKFARRRPAVAALAAVLAIGVPVIARFSWVHRLEQERVSLAVDQQLKRVQAALSSGDPAAALAELERARALHVSAEVLEPLGKEQARLAAIEHGQSLALEDEADPTGVAALAAITSARARWPQDPELAALAGWVLVRTGRRGEAEALLAELNATSGGAEAGRLLAAVLGDGLDTLESGAGRGGDAPPTAAAASPYQALALSMRGEHRRALEILESLLQRRLDSGWVAWLAAEEATRLNDYHTALALAGHSRSLVQELSPERLGRYSLHLRRAGHTAEAAAVAAEAVARAPDSPFVRLHLANARADNHDLAGARRDLEALVADEPGLAPAWSALGATLFDLGHFDDSARACRQAIERDASNVDARINLGNALIELGEAAAAEVVLIEASQMNPDSAFVWNSLGNALRKQRKLDEARAALDRALVLQPRYASALGSLGAVLRAQGKNEAAAQKLREALEIDPDLQPALYNLAGLLFESAPDEAETLYRHLLELAPRDSDTLTNLANLLGNKKEFDEAIALAERACALAPDDAIGLNNLATLYSEAGRAEEAITTLKRAATANPARIEPHANLMLLLAESDPVSAYAHALLLVRLRPEFAQQAQGNLIALRERLSAFESQDPLVLAVKARAAPEGAQAMLDAAVSALEEAGRQGAPDVDPALRLARLIECADVARSLGRDEVATPLAAQADRTATELGVR